MRGRRPTRRGPSGPRGGPRGGPQPLRDLRPSGPRGGPRGGPQGGPRGRGRRGMLSEARVPLGGASVPQRPIPNRDGLMAQMQAELARVARANMATARQRPPAISMDPSKGTFGKGMRQSDYMRQQMPPQQIQRGMGRLPMARANIGQIQTPLPAFTTQMRQPIPRRRIPRRRR
jgi:hypothetical protein